LRYQYQGLMDATCATGRAWKGFHRRHSNFKACRDIGSGTHKPRWQTLVVTLHSVLHDGASLPVMMGVGILFCDACAMRASCSDYDGSSYREVKALWHMPVQTIFDSQICRQRIKDQNLPCSILYRMATSRKASVSVKRKFEDANPCEMKYKENCQHDTHAHHRTNAK